ncbi:MAG: VOC family protein [Vulcanimicrobiota bacterium]
MVKNALAGVAVRNLSAAETYYSHLLGRAPDFKPMPELIEWKFPDGGVLQVYLDKEGKRSGNCSISLVVDDLSSERNRLDQAGQAIHSPITDIWIVQDPEGNQVVLTQPRSEKTAR